MRIFTRICIYFTRICIYFTKTTVKHLTEFGNFTGDKKKNSFSNIRDNSRIWIWILDLTYAKHFLEQWWFRQLPKSAIQQCSFQKFDQL